MKTLFSLVVLILALPGCAFLTGAISEDEAWAVNTAISQVEQGLDRQEGQTAEGAEALGTFALERSGRWADLGLRVLILQAAADGELTDEEVADALSKTSSERAKDTETVMKHLGAMRGFKTWKDTRRAFDLVKAWTLTKVGEGELKRKIVEKGYEVIEGFKGGDK